MKDGLKNWLLALASVALLFGAFEVGARALAWWRQKSRELTRIDEVYRLGALMREAPHVAWRLERNARYVLFNQSNSMEGIEPLPGFHGIPVVSLSTNSFGYRGPEFSIQKPEGAFRIVCQGGSTTLGYPLSDGDSYPDLLRDELMRRYPGRPIEVINAGVPGYTSYKVLQQLEHELLELEPDLVTVAVGYNDGATNNGTDRPVTERETIARLLDQLALPKAVRTLLDPEARSQRYDLLRGKTIYPDEDERAKSIEELSAERYVPNVIPADYEKYLKEHVQIAAERGIRVMLLNLEFPRALYRDARERVARETGTPLVSFPERFAAREWELSDEIERARTGTLAQAPPQSLEKPPGDGEDVTVVFRVVAPEGYDELPFYLTFQTVADFHKPVLQAPWERRKHAMHDDGTGGDQKVGDGIWSLALVLPRNVLVKFFFIRGGPEDAWDPAELGPNPSPDYVNSVRWFYTHDEGIAQLARWGGTQIVPTPVYTYGRHYLMMEAIHQNVDGNRLIARTLADEIAKQEVFVKWLRGAN